MADATPTTSSSSSTIVRASAPGKVFLLGEYAVLDGAPALIAATEARVLVAVAVPKTPNGSDSGWRLHAPGLSQGDYELGPQGEIPGTAGPETHDSLRVVDAVRATLLDADMLPTGPLDVTIDSTSFSRGPAKLGLGSSAAVAVALTAALKAARSAKAAQPNNTHLAAAPVDQRELFELADCAHRLAQNGVGSGGDVAASVHGGLISYTRGESPIPLHWPSELSALAVITGAGSSTPQLVARVDAYRGADPEGYRDDILRLFQLAENARNTLAAPEQFLSLCDDYFGALDALDRHAGAGIITKRHRELRTLAAEVGGVFKSGGAGGGDLGLAFSLSGLPAEKLARALQAAGADILPLRFAQEGVRVETTS